MKLLINSEELDTLLDKRVLIPVDSDTFKLRLTLEDEVFIDVVLNGVIAEPKVDRGHGSIEEWIDEWRSGFSGKRPKGLGNRNLCITRMQELFEKNPEFSKEDVFEARDLYFKDTLKQYGNYEFLQQADYFIRKLDKNTGEISYNLMTYCEQIHLHRKGIPQVGDLTEFSIYDDL